MPLAAKRSLILGIVALLLHTTAAIAKAEDPLAGIGAAIMAGQGGEARPKIIAVLEEARKGSDPSRQGACLLLLALADTSLRDEAAARTHLHEAVRMFDLAGEHLGSWLSLWTLAELERNGTRYDAALPAFERALAVLDRAAAPGERFSIEQLQSIAGFFGFGGMPLGNVLLPPEAVKPILLLLTRFMTRDAYGAALTDAGDLEKAEAQLLEARQSAALFGGMFDWSLAAHFGDLRRRQWRIDEARKEYQAALRSVTVLPAFAPQDGRIQLGILVSLADLELLAGRVDDALAWNDQALALTRKSNDRKREAWILNERGTMLYRARRYDAAEAALNQALALAPPPDVVAPVLTDLALLNMTRGKYGTAASQYERAIEQFQLAGNAAGESYAWTMLVGAYAAMEMRPNVKMALEKAEALATKSGLRASRLVVDFTSAWQRFLEGKASGRDVHDALIRTLSSPEGQATMWGQNIEALARLVGNPIEGPLSDAPVPDEMRPMIATMRCFLEGRALMTKGQYAEARVVLQKGLETNTSRDYQPGFLAFIALSWASEGNFEKATESMTAAARAFDLAIEDLRVEEMLAGYLGSGRNVYFEILIEMLARQNRTGEAFDFSERARSRALLQLLGNTRVEPRRSADEQLMREADALRTQIAEWERSSNARADARSVTGDLREARRRYETLLTRIKSSSSEYAALTTVRPLTIEDVRAELPPDTTMISYYVTRWRVHAWLIDRSSSHHVILSDGAEAVAQASCWGEQLGRLRRGVVPGNAACRERVDAEKVYRALFAPLAPKIATRRLIIIPHRSLHYVPFAALRNPETGRYLIEDFALTYVPSASALRFLRAKESPVDGGAIVFGDPAGTARPALPDAQREAVRVARALRTSPLVGAEAMESRLYRLAGKVDLVHIAAHGTYDSDHPLFSRISLAPGEGRDGNLEVHEILGELDLSGVNLVVLAACDTGLGKRSEGDDLVGLTRALLYAGTPGVIATLWKIGDDATAALMDEFYSRLLAGESAADALRAAQLALLRGDTFVSPNEWAAFALYGIPAGRWRPAGD